MLGLGAYSSGSEDEGNDEKISQPSAPTQTAETTERTLKNIAPENTQSNATQELEQPSDEASRPLVGPFPPEQTSPANATSSQSAGSSPFSSTRALIRDMTLPPIPNLDIPPSPPGSPDPAASKRFDHFLSLKKQGVHFNEKLASNSSLRNPSLLTKMMGHAGIDEQAQYATSLPRDIWDMSALPSWGYKEQLHKSQQGIRRKLEERIPAQREAIDFVSGGTSAETSRDGTPGNGKPRQSAAERPMSGLSRDSDKEAGKRYDLERRPRRTEAAQKRRRSRSPPSRRRSRSR